MPQATRAVPALAVGPVTARIDKGEIMGQQANSEAGKRALAVLFVEDSVLDFELGVAHLTRAGYRVEAARVQEEQDLREALLRREWDLVLADHNLPQFSSMAALKVTKDLKPELPFIIVSGVIGEDVAVDAVLAGADDYVLKNQLSRLTPALERARRATQARARQRAVELALEEQRAQLAAITANMPGVVFQLRWRANAPNSELVYVSEASLQFLGRTPAQMMDKHDRWREMFARTDLEELDRLIAQSAGDLSLLRWQGRISPQYLPTGERRARWIEIAATPRRALNDRVLFDGVLIDITQQKRTEGLLAKSRQQLRELSAHLEQVKEAERAAIAREIHDDIGSTLTGLKVELGWLRKRLSEDVTAQSKLSSLDALVDSAVSASKRIMLELRPSVLDYGIVPAIEWLVQEFHKRMGVPCKFECNSDELLLPPPVSTGLFRVLQEALTNIAKHARATRVEIQLFADAEQVTLEVHDDGVGIRDADQRKTQAFGLRGIEERVHMLGGWVDIGSAPEHGTTIMVSVPRTQTLDEVTV